MSSETRMTVSITFQSPQSSHEGGASTLHERQLDAVPKSKATQIAEDFTAYQAEQSDDRRKLYRYGDDEAERLLALDFEEVVAVVASETTSS